jgi:hypothetical protein
VRMLRPKYPPLLQAVINHARRFCMLLRKSEDGFPSRDPFGRWWVIGRRSEVGAVLGLIVSDWAAERIDADQATRCATRYLGELHEAAHKLLGGGQVFACCAQDEALTLSFAPEHDAVTRVVVAETSMGCESLPTWFDPSALLEFRGVPSPTRERADRRCSPRAQGTKNAQDARSAEANLSGAG